jgi:hypothetical protein
MAFIQTIEFTTSKFDQMQAMDKEWEAATAGKRTTRRQIVARDHDQPDHYVYLVFFDSYEEAMANSNLPETSDFAARMTALADGPATFVNLDVLTDEAG